MDTRKFATGLYLKAADVQDGMIKQNINVSESDGKFGPKLNIWFLDGNRLSLSGTNVRELHRAYGTDSDSWLDKNVRLAVKDYVNNDGKPGKMIVLTAIDPEVPREERPRLTTSIPQEKPPPKTTNGSPRPDMDDEIPF